MRALLARPGTSALAVLALALGIGLTTTMFSIVQGAFLRGLPFDRSDQIMYVGRANAARPDRANPASVEDYLDWKNSQRSFEVLAGFDTAAAVVSGDAGAERYRGARMTANMLSLLRVAPVAGRGFTDADGQPGAAAVVLISHEVWTAQFQQDRSAIGRVLRVNGLPMTIVGVLPPKFGFPQGQNLWMPFQIQPSSKRGSQTIQVVGRLRDGVSMAQASADLAAIARTLEQRYPENKGVTTAVAPYIRQFLQANIINTLWTMLGAVFGVLLIACANVMNLQLARAAERVKDVAVRTALGAARVRILRQLLVEGLLVAGAGALAGLGLASVGITLFNRAIAGTNPPFWIDMRIDMGVLWFVMSITVLAAVVSSLLPALRATRQDLNTVLKDEGRSSTGLRMGRFTRVLVIGEVLLSCCLLIVSGLMIKGVVIIARVQYPFATTDVFTASVEYDTQRYPTEADQVRLADRLEERLAGVPGVRRVALSGGVPTPGGGTPFSIAGRTYVSDNDHPKARLLSGTVGFFDVLRVKIVRGRAFGPGDTLTAPRVAIVGEDFARKFFPGEDPLGQRIQLGLATAAPWLTIVGVVPSLAVTGTPTDVTEYVYRPTSQAPRGLNIIASAAGDPRALTASIRRAAAEVDQDVAVFNSNSLDASLAQAGWAFKVFGTLFMSFGFGALVLASAGLYGVMAFSVRTRTQEIGVRMALGADRGRVLRMVLWQGMWRVLLGVALGLAPAWQLGILMKALLFQVSPTDPMVFGTTIGVLIAAGFAASTVPALRAASVDPLVALRHD
jgi:putative ABC transport system permease protein